MKLVFDLEDIKLAIESIARTHLEARPGYHVEIVLTSYSTSAEAYLVKDAEPKAEAEGGE